ncbi:MAG: 50S ribosomal protein L6 [Clostridia bacterium]
MSRIGRAPITVPAGVDVKIETGLVTVKGPLGTLSEKINSDIKVELADGIIHVTRPTDNKEHRSLHGLSRTLINNMVIGVTTGYSKVLEVNGVGYRVAKKGNALDFTLGFSHPVIVEEVPGISLTVEGTNKITVSGPNKQQVGQFAAEIRELRPPEPYKGKGIKYSDEVIRRKEGKAGGKKK